jgi:hypothetical protein
LIALDIKQVHDALPGIEDAEAALIFRNGLIPAHLRG